MRSQRIKSANKFCHRLRCAWTVQRNSRRYYTPPFASCFCLERPPRRTRARADDKCALVPFQCRAQRSAPGRRVTGARQDDRTHNSMRFERNSIQMDCARNWGACVQPQGAHVEAAAAAAIAFNRLLFASNKDVTSCHRTRARTQTLYYDVALAVAAKTMHDLDDTLKSADAGGRANVRRGCGINNIGCVYEYLVKCTKNKMYRVDWISLAHLRHIRKRVIYGIS